MSKKLENELDEMSPEEIVQLEQMERQTRLRMDKALEELTKKPKIEEDELELEQKEPKIREAVRKANELELEKIIGRAKYIRFSTSGRTIKHSIEWWDETTEEAPVIMNEKETKRERKRESRWQKFKKWVLK